MRYRNAACAYARSEIWLGLDESRKQLAQVDRSGKKSRRSPQSNRSLETALDHLRLSRMV